MTSWKKPTPEQVDKVIASIGHISKYRYFFDRLENPEWIIPLYEKGFFKNPPSTIINENDNFIHYPPWPESKYLARMAKFNPEIVLDVLLKIKDIDNIKVHEDFIDSVLCMPSNLTIKWTIREIEWLRENNNLSYPLTKKYSQLIIYLANEEHIKTTLELCKVLLDILPDPRKFSEFTDDSFGSSNPVPKTKFDIWEYEDLLKKINPVLAEKASIRYFILLSSLLEKSFILSYFEQQLKKPNDHSYIWHPAIEDHEQNITFDLGNILVTSVRDVAEFIINKDNNIFKGIINNLEKRNWYIFQRLSIHLVRKFSQISSDLLIRFLTNKSFFEDDGVRHEYSLLIKENFSSLSQNEQNIIFSWLENGPSTAEWLNSYQKTHGKKPDKLTIDKYIKEWQLKQLSIIKSQLPKKLKDLYDTLIEEFGEPENPEFPVYFKTLIGVTSPKSFDELIAMDNKQILTFVKSWVPQQNIYKPSRDGLSRNLSTAVTKSPDKFYEILEKVSEIDPIYVRGLLSGYLDVFKQTKKLEWQRIFKVCNWILDQPREIPNRKVFDSEDDPDWGRTRMRIADLLYHCLDVSVNMPIFNREIVWSILSKLIEDPHPTKEYEAQFGGDNMDPANLAINTVRGQAMHGIIKYTLWIRRYFENQSNSKELLKSGFNKIPEAKKVLEEHLDIENDPSFAIKAVYGQWFTWLVLIDSDWAKKNVIKIFPIEEKFRNYFYASWSAYIFFNQTYKSSFDLLIEQYKLAIKLIGTPYPFSKNLPDLNKKLADHLMAYYWQGNLEDDLKNQLLLLFWNNADDKLIGHTIEYIGKSLTITETQIKKEILDRLQKLWEHRLSETESNNIEEAKEEITAFGLWFSSGKFDSYWSIKQLKKVLTLYPNISPQHNLFDKLVEISKEYPTDVLICINFLINGDFSYWGISYYEKQLREIIINCLNTKNNQLISEAVDIIHNLGSKGYFQFRDLLPNS